MTYEEFINDILETRGRFACGDEYHERHHIVPRCMGGTNDEDNLIDLFAKEHFEAHRLLALENPENDKLTYAWWIMAHTNKSNQRDYEITAEEYEEARIIVSQKISTMNKGRFAGEKNYFYGIHWCGQEHPMYGRKHTEESKKKISESLKGRMAGENNPNYGKSMGEEQKKKISESLKGKMAGENNPMYGVHRYGEKSPMYGKLHSDESKKKMRNSKLGKYDGRNNPNAKIICQYDLDMKFIKLWEYKKQASEQLQINTSAISMCCFEVHKTAGGFIWRYLYDQAKKDGTIIPGAITLGLITEEEALIMLEKQKTHEEENKND